MQCQAVSILCKVEFKNNIFIAIQLEISLGATLTTLTLFPMSLAINCFPVIFNRKPSCELLLPLCKSINFSGKCSSACFF